MSVCCKLTWFDDIVRFLSVDIDPSWPQESFRRAFAEIRLGTVALGRFWRGVHVVLAGDGPAGELVDAALAHLLEPHQPSRAFRRFAGYELPVACRIDRIYSSLPCEICSVFSGSASVQGDMYDRHGASDHHPVLVRLPCRVRRDRRMLPPFDRCIFDDRLACSCLSCVSAGCGGGRRTSWLV